MTFLDDIPLLKKIADTAYAVIISFALSALVGLILALPVMLLWNFVFGGFHKLNIFQAWALNVLIGILFSQRSK